MSHNVRTHTRRTPGGGTTRVRQHDRRGGRLRDKRGPNPYRAGRNAKRAFGHWRRSRKGRAAIIGLVALIELVAWITLDGTALILMLIAGLCFGLSVLFAGGPR
jgi:hypothetical protein